LELPGQHLVMLAGVSQQMPSQEPSIPAVGVQQELRGRPLYGPVVHVFPESQPQREFLLLLQVERSTAGHQEAEVRAGAQEV
jgi:hypothetical protein